MTPPNDAATGGQRNLAGVLFQLLATLRNGFDGVISGVEVSDELASAMIVVEPVSGGDAELVRTSIRIVDQVKIRRGSKAWSTYTIVDDVLPDLFKAFRPDAVSTYRFVTDNAAGTPALALFVARVRDLHAQSKGPGELDTLGQSFGWKQQRISEADLFFEIVEKLQAPPEAVWSFLACVEIVVHTQDQLEADIDRMLENLVDAREEIPLQKNALVAQLLRLGAGGKSVRVSALLQAVDIPPDRFAHLDNLAQNLKFDVHRTASILRYDANLDVREDPVLPDAPLVVFSGDSGKGKTWRLSRAAFARASEGKCAVLLSARGTLQSVESEIVKRVWLTTLDRPVSLARVARQLQPRLAGPNGVWLTVYLDDLNEPDLARQLAEMPWMSLGIRTVVSAQHRVTRLLSTLVENFQEVAVPDFTLAELRAYLINAKRDQKFVPDDVLFSLLRPALAKIYCQIPSGESWSPSSEYELMDRYWDWATTLYRTQALSPSDGASVLRLAGTLLGDRPVYPWSPSVTHAASLEADVRSRLIEVGILREDEHGNLQASHDRILNWGIAKEIMRRHSEGELSLDELSGLLARVPAINLVSGAPLGSRLGYVAHDLLWLFARKENAETTGRLVQLSMHTGFAKRQHEHLFEEGLGGFGPGIVPTLAWLAKQRHVDRNTFVPRLVASALVKVGKANAEAVGAAAEDLVRADVERSREIGLRVLSVVPAAKMLDALWTLLINRQVALEAAKAAPDRRWTDAIVSKEQASDALTACAPLDVRWLQDKASGVTASQEAVQILWLLVRVEVDLAKPIWLQSKAHLLALIPADNSVIPRAIRHFRDSTELPRANAMSEEADGFTKALWFDALARLEPETALQQLDGLTSAELNGTSEWWFAGLTHRLGSRVKSRLADTIGKERAESQPDLNELAAIYAGDRSLIDPQTFELMIDSYAAHLNNVGCKEDTNRAGWRLRALIASARTPELLERLAARSGSIFEDLVARTALARRGRIDMHRDDDGEEYLRILAAIGGAGYDRVVLADLDRANEHAQIDAVVASKWTTNEAIKARVETIAHRPDADGYRRVQLQKTLASLRADAGIRAMVQNGAPAYLSAAHIRGDAIPWSDADIAEIRRLIESSDVDERLQGINLCGFLDEERAKAMLIPRFREAITTDSEILRARGVLSHLGAYDPDVLPRLSSHLAQDEQGSSTASYFAWSGDAQARQLVVTWLGNHSLKELRATEIQIALRLLRFDDSALGGMEFLRRVLATGLGYGDEGVILSALADRGDNEAAAQLDSIAYQSPRRGDASVVAAIRTLQKSSTSEAVAAAERFYHRKRSPVAASLLMDLAPLHSMDVLIKDCLVASIPVWWQTGRVLRSKAPHKELISRLNAMGVSNNSTERALAAELLGWLPYETPAPVLEALVDDHVDDVERAAIRARQRRLDDEYCDVMIKQLLTLTRPRQWAAMNAIFELCDPAILADPDDPRSFPKALESMGEDFLEEANQILKRRWKKVDKQAERLEKNRRN